MRAPPDFEPEYAREPYAPQFAEGYHVPITWRVGVEAHEAADGVVGGGIVGSCYVGWDLSEDWVVVGEES